MCSLKGMLRGLEGQLDNFARALKCFSLNSIASHEETVRKKKRRSPIHPTCKCVCARVAEQRGKGKAVGCELVFPLRFATEGILLLELHLICSHLKRKEKMKRDSPAAKELYARLQASEERFPAEEKRGIRGFFTSFAATVIRRWRYSSRREEDVGFPSPKVRSISQMLGFKFESCKSKIYARDLHAYGWICVRSMRFMLEP